jgi:uncharacterized membrane protein
VTAPEPETAANRSRARLIDALRGVAILIMAGYHAAWDLSYLGVIGDITADPFWIVLQRLILGSFVALAGGSLVLAHRARIVWPRFWRREAVLAAAAIAVSIGTYIAFGPYFAAFGVLHALVLFSLMALPFLRAPLWVVALTAIAVIAAPLAVSDPLFINPWLAWIGFWPVPPPTVDLVPVFPWFGVMLLGVALMRLVLASPVRSALAWQGGSIARALALIGRWSLLIYLLHQPLLYGAISGIVGLLQPPAPPVVSEADDFVRSCVPNCTASGAPAPYCTAYCSCALDQIESGDLWESVGAETPTAGQQQQTSQVINLCRAMAETADGAEAVP